MIPSDMVPGPGTVGAEEYHLITYERQLEEVVHKLCSRSAGWIKYCMLSVKLFPGNS